MCGDLKTTSDGHSSGEVREPVDSVIPPQHTQTHPAGEKTFSTTIRAYIHRV